jgi:superfamily II DNA or RNA helicase
MVKIQETPTRLLLFGPEEEIRTLEKHYSYRPDRYWMADRYQIWKRHQKTIKTARDDGNEVLAQQLENRQVGWDGWTHILKMKYDRLTSRFLNGVLARGHLHDLEEIAAAYEIEFDKSQSLKNPFEGITEDDIPNDLLTAELNQEQWEIQKRCILAWLSHGIGRNKVTVSGGKTAMFCAAAAMVKTKFPNARFLYFTPTERLSKQVFAETKRFLPDWHISKFGGGADRDNTGKDMVVCTGAILNKRYPELLKSRWIMSFMGLLIDEAQFATSPSWSRIISASSAYFRFAASDTTREDNHERSLAITGLCGPIYERVEANELIVLDRIATPTIDIIHVPQWIGKFDELTHQAEPETPAWVLADGNWHKGTYKGYVFELDEKGDYKKDRKNQPIKIPGLHRIEIDGQEFHVESRWCLLERKYDKAIITFNERNNLIGQRVATYTGRGWPTLVIATRTLHVMILEAVIGKFVPKENIRILYSVHSPNERDEAFAWFKSTPGSVLISPLVKIGVSINEIRGGVVADFVSDWEYLNQLVGRFIRKKPDGTPNEAELAVFSDNQHRSYQLTCSKLFAKMQSIEGYRWKETVVEK